MNEELIRRVADRGVAIAEVPPHTDPTRARFLRRDQLVAALSGTTVVAEAGARSASLYTAQIARDLGRIVAAVPGPVTSEGSTGPHLLIAAGAASLVTGAHDLLELIRSDPTGVLARTQSRPAPEATTGRPALRHITPERPEPPQPPNAPGR